MGGEVVIIKYGVPRIIPLSPKLRLKLRNSLKLPCRSAILTNTGAAMCQYKW